MISAAEGVFNSTCIMLFVDGPGYILLEANPVHIQVYIKRCNFSFSKEHVVRKSYVKSEEVL